MFTFNIDNHDTPVDHLEKSDLIKVIKKCPFKHKSGINFFDDYFEILSDKDSILLTFPKLIDGEQKYAGLSLIRHLMMTYEIGIINIEIYLKVNPLLVNELGEKILEELYFSTPANENIFEPDIKSFKIDVDVDFCRKIVFIQDGKIFQSKADVQEIIIPTTQIYSVALG